MRFSGRRDVLNPEKADFVFGREKSHAAKAKGANSIINSEQKDEDGFFNFDRRERKR